MAPFFHNIVSEGTINYTNYYFEEPLQLNINNKFYKECKYVFKKSRARRHPARSE